MLEMYKQSLTEAGCFSQEYPDVFKIAAKAIPGNIPEKMKVLMAATELTAFAGHLRKNINWQGTSVPVNMISFLIGESGRGKGLSIKSIGNILKPAYAKINEYRDSQAKLDAADLAEEDNKKRSDWKKYYSKPRPLKAGISTLQGMMKHLATLEKGILGAGYMYVDEIGSELVSNSDLSENIVALAIGYDTGEIAPKILKDNANQLEPIHNLPYTALMFGSPANILYNETVKRKFTEEFNTKLSRRSHFAFIKESTPLPTFDSIEESREHTRKEVAASREVAKELSPYFSTLVDATSHEPLTVTQEVEDLFSDYRAYNEWYADTIPKQYPTTILHRQHLQWKSLKLAGAIAIIKNEETITADHYVSAINFTEMYANDMFEFEVELDKEPYELLVTYMHSIQQNGFASVSIHQLRKLGFITGQGTDRKLQELVKLANSADNSRFELVDKYIHFYLADE